MDQFILFYLRTRIDELAQLIKSKDVPIDDEPQFDTYIRGGIDELERIVRLIKGDELDDWI